MTISLSTIRPASGSAKPKKRIGRGNSSGHGTYSGHGLKGQKARSGVSGLKRLGMRQILLRTPKKRGFRSAYPKDQVVNIADLNGEFKDGEEISPKVLFRHKLISDLLVEVKLLGAGELKLKNLKFNNIKMSRTVAAQIKKMDGQII